MRDGAVVCDATPREFLRWAPSDLETPGARLFALAGIDPPPVSVKEARLQLRGQTPSCSGATGGRRPLSCRVALEVKRVWLEPRGRASAVRACP